METSCKTYLMSGEIKELKKKENEPLLGKRDIQSYSVDTGWGGRRYRAVIDRVPGRRGRGDGPRGGSKTC